MNPDQLALSGFEQALRDDRQGRLLKSETDYFQQEAQRIKNLLNAGVTAQEYASLENLKNTLGTASNALSEVWHDLHAQ